MFEEGKGKVTVSDWQCYFTYRIYSRVGTAAEEIAQALSQAKIPGLHAIKKIKPKDFEDDLEGQQGIIFFKDFWRRGNETFGNRSGDHIDLWNGRRLTDWLSYPRIQLGFSIEGSFSDYHESKEIWFWKVI
ncbi:type VI secretion system (T6SS) effector Tae4 (amidase) [Pseudomonas sp. URMO17WK12:I6]|jgi:hypothetical protein|uniref:T6SS effector amidase Tae4 family protein n=1 Tax=Pseudomonas sp. URMO17WK12:I6 TaxID=1261629 RepID=UPI000DAC9D05|nr:T6SS effector amidase Tae4 family protein [Pseudomonas sp. URMO17WK12:I6]PZW63162.1 type VI secretion system (T6SS) effector Tae4 (amidase) [Pseudomonas sp. URMO17WK12:I6]